jgi:hypothetical protein
MASDSCKYLIPLLLLLLLLLLSRLISTPAVP